MEHKSHKGNWFYHVLGWLGVVLVLSIAPAQLIEILRTGDTSGISLVAYALLMGHLICHVTYAWHIKDPIFLTAHAVNLIISTWVLYLVAVGG